MEKTSREYAEKLAEEKYPKFEGKNDALYNFLLEGRRNDFIDTWLKAVEETNAKELKEALEELLNTCPCDSDIDMDFWNANQKAINALNKTKA